MMVLVVRADDAGLEGWVDGCCASLPTTCVAGDAIVSV